MRQHRREAIPQCDVSLCRCEEPAAKRVDGESKGDEVAGSCSILGRCISRRIDGLSCLRNSFDLSTSGRNIDSSKNIQLPAFRKTYHCDQHYIAYASLNLRHCCSRCAKQGCVCRGNPSRFERPYAGGMPGSECASI